MITPLLKSHLLCCSPLEWMAKPVRHVYVSSVICKLQYACYRSMYPVSTKYYLNLNGGRKYETIWHLVDGG